jgi:hypothetical protein
MMTKIKSGGAATLVIADGLNKSYNAIKVVHQIYVFLLNHWPEISPWLHGISISTYKPHWHLWLRDTETLIVVKDEEGAERLLIEFKRDYAELPPPVQEMITKKFGTDVIQELTR